MDDRGRSPSSPVNMASDDERDVTNVHDVTEKTSLLASTSRTSRDSTSTGYGTGAESDVIIKDGKQEKKEEAKQVSFGKLFRYATCCDRLFLVIGSLFAIGHGAGWPLLTIIFGQMTDSFINHNSTSPVANGTGPVDFGDQMSQYALKYVYIACGVFAAAYIHCQCWSRVCERQVHKMRKEFFKAILRQEMGWFDQHSSGELSTRLADDLERVREGIGDKFGVCLQHTAAFISGFAIGLWKGWKLALVMMSLTPLLAACAAFMGYTISTIAKREQSAYAGAGAVAEEVLSCIRTVVSFCGQKKEVERYDKAVKETLGLGYRKSVITGLGMGFFMICLFGAYALALWFGSTQVIVWQESFPLFNEGMSPGTVFTVFFCVMIGSFSIGNIAPHLSTVATAKGAAAYIYDVIDRIPEINASSEMGYQPRDCEGRIEVDSVNFFYPVRPDVQVLSDYSMRVEPGQTVALVGSSGCGKTTIVSLILRFYDPRNGRILIDGVDLRELNINWLRRQIGIVSQEPILFGCSIEENIMYGRDDVTQSEVIMAAKAANAHKFITQLPDGYQTLVGERGVQLSGGQKQRVAIARALVRNPKILLLDEATSALDSETEKSVQEALDAARQGRTTIVVAHRLSTIKNADVIFAIDQGKLSEIGNHDELMAKEGVYYQLVTLQNFIADEDEGVEKETGEIDRIHTPDNGSPVRKRPLAKRTLSRSSAVDCEEDKEEEEEESKAESDVKKESFFRMMALNSPECHLILLGSLASSLLGASMPVFAVFFSKIIQVFAETGDQLRRDAVFWSLMFLALGGSQFIAQLGYIISFGVSGERLTCRLRTMVFKNMLRQDIGWFDHKEHSTGALTTRLATDATLVKTGAGIRIGIIIQSSVSLLAGLAISLVFGWKLALVVVAMAPIMAVAGSIHMRTVKGNQKRDSKLLEEAGKTASESIENMRTVQALTLEQRMYDRYAQLLEKPYRENLWQSIVFSLTFAFSQAVVFLIYAAAFRFGAYLVEIGDMTPENVYRVFFAITFSGMAIGQASSLLPDYAKAQLGAGHIYKLLDAIPAIDSYSETGLRPSELDGEIQFENVEFVYPTRPSVRVLQGINLQIKPGTTVALVGASGCGKSTMVSLLQRFYDPTAGRICIDGQDVRSLNPTWLRSNISVVSQEPILFDTTIANNIAYGVEGEPFIADVIKAAKLANIHDFIMSLPDDYDTRVGEKGTQLSGGQKQRVAIARAMITNPKILLLDEATSSLDTESEKIVQEALNVARQGRTCLIIAHRLSTVQTSDLICVMEGGRLVEQGTHQELVSQRGAYYSLTSGQRNILT